jgi:hypothetical protein
MRRKGWSVVLTAFLWTGVVFAADVVRTVEEKDSNADERIDVWSEYDASGNLVSVARDKHVDGKPDRWIYLENGRIVRREWDRNFDGKPDFRTVERAHRLIEKSYDDNFDGTFERTVKAPAKGTSGRLDKKIS